jgi:hypothetical protein
MSVIPSMPTHLKVEGSPGRDLGRGAGVTVRVVTLADEE